MHASACIDACSCQPTFLPLPAAGARMQDVGRAWGEFGALHTTFEGMKKEAAEVAAKREKGIKRRIQAGKVRA